MTVCACGHGLDDHILVHASYSRQASCIGNAPDPCDCIEYQPEEGN